MRRQLVQLLRNFTQARSRSTSWRPNKVAPAQLDLPVLPPAARIDRAEIIRRTEAQVRNLVAEEAPAAVDEDVIQLIVEARRGIWGGPNGGKTPFAY